MRTDFELLNGWKAGDAEAGNELLERHFAALYRFFHNKVGGGIDDLVQQTLLGCVEGRVRFRAESSFRTFLFAVARFVLYNHFDARRAAERIDYGTVSALDLGESPSQVVHARAEQRLLGAALRRLPLDDQIVLELYYWESLTGPELAEALELPEPAVRSRIRRALERLRERLGELASSTAELESVSTDLEGWAASLVEQRDA